MKNKLSPILLAAAIILLFHNNILSQTSESTDSANNKKIEWLRNNVVQIASVDPGDENYSDLELIKTKIGKSRIVLLGEESHGDGTTFLAKTRIIKFLVKEMGFDVIVFESGLYDCKKVNELIKDGAPAIDAIRKGIFGIWNKSEQFQPLVEFIDKNRDELQIAGMDCQFTGEVSKEFFISDLELFLAKKGINVNNYADWQQSKTLLKNISEERFIKPPPLPPDTTQQNDFVKTLSQIISRLQKRSDDSETNFWIQVLKSTIQEGRSIWNSYGIEDFSKIPVETRNIRDIQMGDNLIWQAETNYPDKKIIVWAATAHIARNLSAVEAKAYPQIYKGTITMGDIARKKLGNELYAIGFTAYEGYLGWANNQYKRTIEKPEPNSLEDLFFKTGFENCFLDLRNVNDGGRWLNEKIISRPFGYLITISEWRQNLDGMIFTRTMIPSTKITQ